MERGPRHTGPPWARPPKVAYSKGMASGFPARVAVVAICVTAGLAHADRRRVAVVSLTADPDASKLADELDSTLVDHVDLQPLRTMLVTALRGPFDDEDAENALGLAQPDFRGAGTAAKRGIDALAMVTPTPEMLQIYADLMFDMGQAQLGQTKPIDASRSFS